MGKGPVTALPELPLAKSDPPYPGLMDFGITSVSGSFSPHHVSRGRGPGRCSIRHSPALWLHGECWCS